VFGLEALTKHNFSLEQRGAGILRRLDFKPFLGCRGKAMTRSFRLILSSFAFLYLLMSCEIQADDPPAVSAVSGSPAAEIQTPVILVHVCIWARCNSSGPYKMYEGDGENLAAAIADAEGKARISLPCPLSATLNKFPSNASPATACPDQLLFIQPVMTREAKAVCGQWLVEVCCVSRCGNPFSHTGTGSTFCEAYKQAHKHASFGASLDGGVRYCRWKVLERPCCCIPSCK
jgi:hypothetical protein